MYDLSKVGLEVPNGWHNNLASVNQACALDGDFTKTTLAIKKKFGHGIMLPLMTDLKENWLVIATQRNYATAGEGVIYLRNWPNKCIARITKPPTLAGLVRCLGEPGYPELDFDLVEDELEELLAT